MYYEPVRKKGLLMVDFVLRILATVLVGLLGLVMVVMIFAVMGSAGMLSALYDVYPGMGRDIQLIMGIVIGVVVGVFLVLIGIQVMMLVLLNKRKKAYRVLMIIGTVLLGLNTLSSLQTSNTSYLYDFYDALGYNIRPGLGNVFFSFLILAVSIAYTVYLFKSEYCKVYFSDQPMMPVKGAPPYGVPPAPPYGQQPAAPYGQPYAPPPYGQAPAMSQGQPTMPPSYGQAPVPPYGQQPVPPPYGQAPASPDAVPSAEPINSTPGNPLV